VVKVDEKKLKRQIIRDGVLTIQLQNCNWSLHFAILAGPHCGSVESMVIGSGRTPPVETIASKKAGSMDSFIVENRSVFTNIDKSDFVDLVKIG
jgi:hypothetical protein